MQSPILLTRAQAEDALRWAEDLSADLEALHYTGDPIDAPRYACWLRTFIEDLTAALTHTSTVSVVRPVSHSAAFEALRKIEEVA